MAKDDAGARAGFTAARAEQEKIVRAQPDYGPAICALGLIDAGLGRKDDALREGRRAVGLLPVEKDAFQRRGNDQVFGNDRCMGRRQRSRLPTACGRDSHSGVTRLWTVETDAVLGTAARPRAV